MKDAKKDAGAHFKGNKTAGEVRCPRCQETENQWFMQEFNNYWVLALPEPLPEPKSQTSAASDHIAKEIINQAGKPPPAHYNSKASDHDGRDARRDTPVGFVIQPKKSKDDPDDGPLPELDDPDDNNPWLGLNDD